MYHAYTDAEKQVIFVFLSRNNYARTAITRVVNIIIILVTIHYNNEIRIVYLLYASVHECAQARFV